MKSDNAARVEAILGVFDEAARPRSYALETDCADCGQSEAGFRFTPTDDAICEGCTEQYQPEDLTPRTEG